MLVCDAIPYPDGGGISQTLYNLFSGSDWDLTFLLPEGKGVPGANALEGNRVSYKQPPLKLFQNRLGKWFNHKLQQGRMVWYQRQLLPVAELPGPAHCLVVVSTTNPEHLLVAWLLNKQHGYTVLPYFMDDWLAGNQLKWRGNSLPSIATDLLAQAPAWLMISKALQQRLADRYQLQPKPTLFIHNPAPVAAEQVSRHYEQGLIVYAGSIWPMHYNALLAVAKAVAALVNAGQPYRLLVYTQPASWNAYPELQQLAGVHYGGHLAYEACGQAMRKAWLLLCTAAFGQQQEAFSSSSVQTKLTDYMAAGRPVLFVGPANSASGHFVQQWDCGFCLHQDDPSMIAGQLQQLALKETLCHEMAANGLQAAKGSFSKAEMQARLISFLRHYGPGKIAESLDHTSSPLVS